MATDNRLPDRILDALLRDAEQQALQRSGNPSLRRNDPYLLDLRKNEYQAILDEYSTRSKRKGLTRNERQGLTYVRARLKKVDAQLHPTFLNRLRYSKPVDWLINWLQGRAALVDGYDRRIQLEDKKTIQEQNFQRLDKELKEAGFKVGIEKSLRQAIGQGHASFYLTYDASADAKTAYTFFFKKFPGTDNYYLEKFNASTKRSIMDVLRGIPVVRQDFSSVNEPAFTAQEAAKLVHGVPIAKTTGEGKQWATVDGSGQLNWVNFDLLDVLSRFPIKEMHNLQEMKTLVGGLESGQTREVTLIGDDDEQRTFKVQVDPYAQDLLFKKDGVLVDADRIIRSNPSIEKMYALTEKERMPRQGAHLSRS